MTRINTTVRRFPWHEDAPLPGDGKPKSQSGFENEIENSFSISAETTSLAGADLTGADVTGANFAEADLDKTIFSNVKGLDSAKGLDTAANRDKAIF